MLRTRTIRYILLGFLLLILRGGYAQFDLENFLLGANNDDLLSPYKAQLDFLNDENLNSPWVHRFEFRTRTNDLNLSQEDFRFRIAPTNPAEVKANKNYFKAQEKLTNTKFQLALNEALMDRYQHFLEWSYLEEMKELYSQELRIIEDELSIYENQINSLEFDYEDYLDKDKERTMLGLDLKKIDHEISKSNFKMRSIFKYTGSLELAGAELLTIEQISGMMETVNKSDSSHLKLIEAEQELELANYDVQVDKAESRRNIGYLQAELDTDRGNELNEHMGFQVGIRIPLSNPERPDLQRTQLDILKDQFDSQKERKWLESERLGTALDLDHMLQQYEYLKVRLEQMRNLRENMVISDPLFLLKTIENQTRVEKSLINLKFEIYRLYLEYLDLYGMIVQMPLRNYLSSDLEIIQKN